MQLLGSLVFTTGLYAIGFSIVASLTPYPQRFALTRGWAVVLLWVLKRTCRLDYRVEGLENLPSRNHVALVKHSSSWETFAQIVLLPPQAWVLKRELTWIPFIGWGVRLLRGIAVDRGAGHIAVKSVLDQGKQLLGPAGAEHEVLEPGPGLVQWEGPLGEEPAQPAGAAVVRCGVQ